MTPELALLLVAANNALANIIQMVMAASKGQVITPEQLDEAAQKNQEVADQINALRTDI